MTTTLPTSAMPVHPVRIDAELDPGVSRWLWLVKWFLLIPHFVVLAFLWLAFGVTTVLAFFAILVTARYPRALFDFNVGVLRWWWRVAYYGYGVLGTDRYPPFSLHDVPSYPAHLDVEPPGRLSRGKVLVKWWLLAIPHYLVLALLLNGGWSAVTDQTAHIGLIGLLVAVAAVVLLFTGRYPHRLFDLVVGLNRWVFRVWAYAALMTDHYPPFALDQGGNEPGVADTSGGPPTHTSATASATPQRPLHTASGWSAGRVVSLTAGALLVVAALGSGGAAATLVGVDRLARDDGGFVSSDTTRLETSSSALISRNLEFDGDVPASFLSERLLGTTLLTADSRQTGDLFAGIGPTDQVRRFLAGVAHDTVTGMPDGRPTYRRHGGVASAGRPAEQTFWEVHQSGPGELRLQWEPSGGEWTYVVMNADGTPGVAADVAVGAEFPVLDDVVVVLAASAAGFLLIGAVLIAIPLRKVSRGNRAGP